MWSDMKEVSVILHSDDMPNDQRVLDLLRKATEERSYYLDSRRKVIVHVS